MAFRSTGRILHAEVVSSNSVGWTGADLGDHSDCWACRSGSGARLRSPGRHTYTET
jgi:hypothetical protein